MPWGRPRHCGRCDCAGMSGASLHCTCPKPYCELRVSETARETRSRDARSEISTTRGGTRSIPTELGAPDCAFVTNKRADPIACPLAQHGVPIFAARYKEVSPVV